MMSSGSSRSDVVLNSVGSSAPSIQPQNCSVVRVSVNVRRGESPQSLASSVSVTPRLMSCTAPTSMCANSVVVYTISRMTVYGSDRKCLNFSLRRSMW